MRDLRHSMTLAPAARLGHFQIVASIGASGGNDAEDGDGGRVCRDRRWDSHIEIAPTVPKIFAFFLAHSKPR